MTVTTSDAEPVIAEATLRSALSTRERPARPTPLAASIAFGWRAMLKIRHVPMQLFDVTAFPIMFVLLYTYLFGGALAGSPREYLQELLPGILVMTVTWITMYTGQALNTDISKGVFDRFRSLPIWRPAAASVVARTLGDVRLESDPAALTAAATEPERVAVVLTALAAEGVAVAEMTLGQPSLDQVFLALTGHPAEDAPTTEEAA